MTNSLMPNERKQLNKSYISLVVPLTDAIQEVGPISRLAESPASQLAFPTLWSLQGSVVEGEHANYTVSLSSILHHYEDPRNLQNGPRNY